MNTKIMQYIQDKIIPRCSLLTGPAIPVVTNHGYLAALTCNPTALTWWLKLNHIVSYHIIIYINYIAAIYLDWEHIIMFIFLYETTRKAQFLASTASPPGGGPGMPGPIIGPKGSILSEKMAAAGGKGCVQPSCTIQYIWTFFFELYPIFLDINCNDM